MKGILYQMIVLNGEMNKKMYFKVIKLLEST